MNKDEGKASPGTVYLVGAGPGDPGLLTLRGAELLASADVILHDELVDPSLLESARAGAEVRSVGKRGGNPVAKQASQSAIEEALVSLAQAGRSVVRLKGGDPFLFGRGSEEAEALVNAKVPFEVVPGVCSPLGATAYAGISVTHRDLASSVVFVSGTTRSGADYSFAELASVRGTICVLMGMRKLDDVAKRLMRDAQRAPDSLAAVIQWGTRPEQGVVEGRLAEIAARAREARLESPAIVVVGPVVGLRNTLRWFDVRPLFGKRVAVLRPEHQVAGTAELLRRRGAEAIAVPSIEIHGPPDPALVARAARELGSYGVVAFTSVNAVEWFFRELDAQGLDARAFGGALVAAVGTGTMAALAVRGVRADIVPAAHHGGALAEAIVAAERVRGRPARVLLPRARVAREVLPQTLERHGFEVHVVAVYETRRPSDERSNAFLERVGRGEVDAILLTSSSTADALADMLAGRGALLSPSVVLASIGEITTRTAEARGLTVTITAEESTSRGLVDALERWFSTA